MTCPRSLTPLAAGLSLALATMLFSVALSEVQLLEFHAVLLTLIAAVYIVFALQNRLAAGVGLELIGVVSFTLLALAGLWASPWFIVVGLVLHGVWDVLHHNGWDVVKTKVPQGYIPFCAGYDWLLALFLGVRLSF